MKTGESEKFRWFIEKHLKSKTTTVFFSCYIKASQKFSMENAKYTMLIENVLYVHSGGVKFDQFSA